MWIMYYSILVKEYRAQLKGEPQVAWMVQPKLGISGKQQLQQNSPNLGTAF